MKLVVAVGMADIERWLRPGSQSKVVCTAIESTGDFGGIQEVKPGVVRREGCL
jgi:hypothetical protein